MPSLTEQNCKQAHLGFDLSVANELDPKTILKIKKMGRLMEAKTMELEVYFEQHREEFDIIMDAGGTSPWTGEGRIMQEPLSRATQEL
ncbi:protein of unknown function, might belong to Methylated-DNA--protein-cysteine methyltransferase [Shewanella benthica]|uniref:Uncharacterized protein n=1 Tax=Shewanella benthica TaxID=43661 RepID=A0A330M2H9_9GAMM|nr:hypothetical protein [Shewanella benthica]SQH76245.1 protein of unknown function, might belong to Methylated-DNA--protein-cysteine methyltransferase [Shewanella benthica]